MLLALIAPAFAEKGAIELGGGLRDVAATFDRGSLGVNLFGRYGLSDALSVEAGAYVSPFPAEPSGLAEALLLIAYESNPDTTFRQPLDHEQLAARVAIDWSIGPRIHAREVSGGVHLLAGVEARVETNDYALVNRDFSNADVALVESGGASRLVLGPAVGVGLDAWFGERVGLRWTAFERFAVEEEPDYGNRLPNGDPAPLEWQVTTSLAWSLDVMVAL